MPYWMMDVLLFVWQLSPDPVLMHQCIFELRYFYFQYLWIRCNIFCDTKLCCSAHRFLFLSTNSNTFVSPYSARSRDNDNNFLSDSLFGFFITFTVDCSWQIKHKLYSFSVFLFFHGVSEEGSSILKENLTNKAYWNASWDYSIKTEEQKMSLLIHGESEFSAMITLTVFIKSRYSCTKYSLFCQVMTITAEYSHHLISKY